MIQKKHNFGARKFKIKKGNSKELPFFYAEERWVVYF